MRWLKFGCMYKKKLNSCYFSFIIFDWASSLSPSHKIKTHIPYMNLLGNSGNWNILSWEKKKPIQKKVYK